MPSVMQTISGSPASVRFEDRVRGKRRRHEDDGGIRAGLFDRLLDGVEYGPALVGRAAFAGVTPPTTFVPYSAQPLA